jgi:hypothetical protein
MLEYKGCKIHQDGIRVTSTNDWNMVYSYNQPTTLYTVSGIFGLTGNFKSVPSAKDAIDRQIAINIDMIRRYNKLGIPLLHWMKHPEKNTWYAFRN